MLWRPHASALVYVAKIPISSHSEEANEHRRNKTDPAQERVDTLLSAFEIVQRFADWSKKYPNNGIYSFSVKSKMDAELEDIENAAKAWMGKITAKLSRTGPLSY